jgi:hypothetical protein
MQNIVEGLFESFLTWKSQHGISNDTVFEGVVAGGVGFGAYLLTKLDGYLKSRADANSMRAHIASCVALLEGFLVLEADSFRSCGREIAAGYPSVSLKMQAGVPVKPLTDIPWLEQFKVLVLKERLFRNKRQERFLLYETRVMAIAEMLDRAGTAYKEYNDHYSSTMERLGTSKLQLEAFFDEQAERRRNTSFEAREVEFLKAIYKSYNEYVLRGGSSPRARYGGLYQPLHTLCLEYEGYESSGKLREITAKYLAASQDWKSARKHFAGLFRDLERGLTLSNLQIQWCAFWLTAPRYKRIYGAFKGWRKQPELESTQ